MRVLSLSVALALSIPALAQEGRIRRVRLNEVDDATVHVVVTTESTDDRAEEIRVFVDPEPLEGSAPLVPELGVGGLVREDGRFTFDVPDVSALFAIVVAVNSSKGDTDVPLDALLEEGDSFGAPVRLEPSGVEARARVAVGPDGRATVEVSLVVRQGETLAPDTTVTLDGQPPTSRTTLRTWRVAFYGDPNDPPAGAYSTSVRWEDAAGEAIDATSVVLDAGDGPRGTRIESVVLGETQRGDTRLVTRVSSPDARPLGLSTVVAEADGVSVLAEGDVAPTWTERQFIARGLVLDGLGDDGLAITAFPMGEDGDVLTEPVHLALLPERPTEALPELQSTLFWEDQAQAALFPESDRTWRVFLRSASDVPVDHWVLAFDDGTERIASLDRVWRQYKQVARGVPLSEGTRSVEAHVVDPESGTEISTTGLEAEGAVGRTGASVEDIEAFVQSLAGTSSTAPVQVSRARTIVRR